MKLCNWFVEFPEYRRCFNPVEVGSDRCAKHRRERAPRPGALSQAVKDYVRRRDKYSCAVCGGPALEVDHIRELSSFEDWELPQANSLTNLQLLCDVHHREKTDAYLARVARRPVVFHDRSTSARARKRRRLRSLGFGVD